MKAGFAKVDITPPLGSKLAGYFQLREATGIINPLSACAVAFCDDSGKTAVVVTLDILELMQRDTDVIRTMVAEKTGLDRDAVLLCCTHTHLGPEVSGMLFAPDEIYNKFFFSRICDAVKLAVDDLKDAEAFVAKKERPGLAFLRIFKMHDGSIAWNPGFGTLVKEPAGTPDDQIQLIKFVRPGAPDIAIVNFQMHPDVIGGNEICTDWPGYVRDYVEYSLSDEANGLGVRAICINGTQGDTVHADRYDEETHLIKKYRVGVKESKNIGRKIAGAVLEMYTYANSINTDAVFYKQSHMDVKTVDIDPADFPISHEIVRVFGKGTREERAAYKAMERPFDISVAKRNLRMEHEPKDLILDVSCVGIGDIAFVGFPGEPFTEIGRRTKKESPFALTMVSCCANGSEGYFPTAEYFDSENYESQTTRFVKGTAERLADTAIGLMNELKK